MMGKKHFDRSREVIAKDTYMIASLFQLLREKGAFTAGDPFRSSIMGFEYIKFPGEAKLNNMVSVKENKITISGMHLSTMSRVMFLVLDAISDGWSMVFGFDLKKMCLLWRALPQKLSGLSGESFESISSLKNRIG